MAVSSDLATGRHNNNARASHSMIGHSLGNAIARISAHENLARAGCLQLRLDRVHDLESTERVLVGGSILLARHRRCVVQ